MVLVGQAMVGEGLIGKRLYPPLNFVVNSKLP